MLNAVRYTLGYSLTINLIGQLVDWGIGGLANWRIGELTNW